MTSNEPPQRAPRLYRVADLQADLLGDETGTPGSQPRAAHRLVLVRPPQNAQDARDDRTQGNT